MFLRHKARYVGRGDLRKFKPKSLKETFLPTGSQYTFNLRLNNIILNKLDYVIADADTAYLNAIFEGLLYMVLDPEVVKIMLKIDPSVKDYVNEDGTMYVRITKALYGLQESAKLWYNTLATAMQEIGFRKSSYDEALFFRKEQDGSMTFIFVYVDDMLFSGRKENLRATLDALQAKFKLKESEMSPRQFDFLGMRCRRDSKDDGSFILSQPGLIDEIIADCKETAATPCDVKLYIETDARLFKDVTKFRSLLMKVMYVSRTRPDLKVALGYLATRMQAPTFGDWEKLQRVVKYLNGTKHMGLRYKPVENMQVYASSDASYGPFKDGKSNTGLVITVGYPNAPIIARSSKQKSVANSSTAAELIAFSTTLEEVLWMVNLLEELGFEQDTVQIEQDNQSTMRLIEKGPSSAGRTKWLNIKYFWVNEKKQEGIFDTKYVESLKLLADGLTKPLGKKAFIAWRQRILNH